MCTGRRTPVHYQLRAPCTAWLTLRTVDPLSVVNAPSGVSGATPREPAVCCRDLRKTYIFHEQSPGIAGALRDLFRRQRRERVALTGLNLEVPPGQILSEPPGRSPRRRALPSAHGRFLITPQSEGGRGNASPAWLARGAAETPRAGRHRLALATKRGLVESTGRGVLHIITVRASAHEPGLLPLGGAGARRRQGSVG